MKTRTAITLAAFALSFHLFSDASEDLILYRIGNVPVEIRDDDPFATMLINDGDAQSPVPRYILAIKDSRTVIDTRDLSLFAMFLQTIPKGSVVFTYDSCSVSRSYGLTPEQYQSYMGVFKEAGLSMCEYPRLTCYCPER